VTNFGAGGSTTGLGGTTGFAGVACTGSNFVSTGGTAGFATGGLTATCAGGCSAAAAFSLIARNTSPGREMCERSILVLISSSACVAARDDLAWPGVVSAWPFSALRTSSASCSSSELECVFFSVTPTSVSTSRIALLLTSSSRARSLIRIFIRLLSFSRSARFACVDYACISNLTGSVSFALSSFSISCRGLHSSRTPRIRSGVLSGFAIFPRFTCLPGFVRSPAGRLQRPVRQVPPRR